MINYEKVAEKIFSVIKGHGHTLSMYADDGMETTDPTEARRFFVAKPNYMVTLDDESNTIKINKNSNLSLEDLESIMKQMKNLARANMLNTHVQVFGKEITPKDFAYQAKKYRNKEMGEITEATYDELPSGYDGLIRNGEDVNPTGAWKVMIPVNKYNGKYYTANRTAYYVPTSEASTEEEAINYVFNNKEQVIDKLSKAKTNSGRSLIQRPLEKNIFIGPNSRNRISATMINNYLGEASLSRMSGSTKTSYQTLESVKMIVRHRKPVAEEVRGSRSRQISAIFLEQAGERFRFPHNNLQGARAMARHMYEGGEMGDAIGTYIVEAVGNLIQLNEFVRYARTNKLINENSEDIIATVQENIATLRGELKGLTGANSYAKISEAIAAREANVLEEDDTTDLRDLFTVRKFDEKFGDTLPLVNRLMNEKTAWRDALVEASTQTVWLDAKESLAEDDILEFDSPVQKMGYKIQKVANRMVETGDLKTVVSRVAGKLIEGETISEFEKTIVRNVMENAKIEEAKVCEACDCEPCECEKNTFESILDGYDLKMKMLEHEDIFVEGDWDNDVRRGESESGATGMGYPAQGHDQECAWWAGCHNDATTTEPHPVLGDVPICDRCAARLRKMDEKLEEEPGDWDHGYDYEGSGNVDFDDYPEDLAGMDIERDDCEECDGTGLGLDDVSDCYACNGTGKVEDEQDEYDGQPSERDEWQDFMGGDDWDHGQFDESLNKLRKSAGIEIVESDAEKASSGKVDPEDFMDDCQACDGTGIFRNGEDCENCDGEGYV